MPGPLYAPPLLILYPFRFRDPVSRKWVRARYVAERHEIAARYVEWEIVGPPELRRPSGSSFKPASKPRRGKVKIKSRDVSTPAPRTVKIKRWTETTLLKSYYYPDRDRSEAMDKEVFEETLGNVGVALRIVSDRKLAEVKIQDGHLNKEQIGKLINLLRSVADEMV